MYHGQSKQALQRKQNIGAKFKPAVILRLHQVCLTLSGAILRKTFLPPPNAKIDHLGTIKFLIIVIVINNIVHFKALPHAHYYNPRFVYFLSTFLSSFRYCDLWPYVWLVFKRVRYIISSVLSKFETNPLFAGTLE